MKNTPIFTDKRIRNNNLKITISNGKQSYSQTCTHYKNDGGNLDSNHVAYLSIH